MQTVQDYTTSRIDTTPQVDLRDFATPGQSIAVAGPTGTGKSSLVEWLALGFHQGRQFDLSKDPAFEGRFRHWVFGKELVIVRDEGSYAWLDFANRGIKLRVYVPRGAVFKPNPNQVKLENLEIVEYEIEDLWHTLLDKFLNTDAEDYIHVIEYDCFAEEEVNEESLIASFHRELITTFVAWKKLHKLLKICLVYDEFQDISQPERESTIDKALRQESWRISRSIIKNFRKYRIRFIPCLQSMKYLAGRMRGQFRYYMLKNMSEDEHVDTTKKVLRATLNCEKDQVVLYGIKGKAQFERITLGTDIIQLSNPDLTVEIRKPPNGLTVGVVEEAELRSARTMAHFLYLIDSLTEDGFHDPVTKAIIKMKKIDLEKRAKYGPKGLGMWEHRWRPVCEQLGLIEPKKPKHIQQAILDETRKAEPLTEDALTAFADT